MCVFAWRSAWFSGADLGRLRNHSMAMGAAHNELQWGKLLWTHLWIDHMYYFAKKWRILSTFHCFTMEGSHRRLKRMLRNSGGLSLLRGRLGVQVVVDNHTIDLGGSIRTYQNCRSSQTGTTPKRGLKNHFEKLHNCALQGTPLKSRELSKMAVCRGYHMCHSKFMYPFQIWALQCPSNEKSNSSISSAGAFQTTLQNAT